MWERVKEWAALTRTEQRVILVLVGALLVGAGIKFFRQAFPSVRQFEYQASDSTFAALNDRIDKDPGGGQPEATSGPININTASKAALIKLPGIGEVMAERIILHREDVGPFQSVDELVIIKGISKRRVEQLRPLITVR